MVDKDTVRAGYDELGETYADQRSEAGPEGLAAFLDELSDGTRVLDAGCGQGTPVLSQLDEATVGVGIDLSRTQLGQASENAPRVALAQADMTRLPFESGAFDAVTALHSLIHIPEGDHETVLTEFARVLKPGGRVLLTEGTSEWSGSNPDWLDAGAEMQWYIAGPAATREHLQSAGFAVVDEREIWSEMDEAAWQLFEGRLDA